MCPLCIGAATWYLAGASSVSGTIALVLKGSRIRDKTELDDMKHLDCIGDDRSAKREIRNNAPE